MTSDEVVLYGGWYRGSSPPNQDGIPIKMLLKKGDQEGTR